MNHSSKAYKWSIDDDTINIKDFDDYGTLVVVDKQIIRTNPYKKELIFNEIE